MSEAQGGPSPADRGLARDRQFDVRESGRPDLRTGGARRVPRLPRALIGVFTMLLAAVLAALIGLSRYAAALPPLDLDPAHGASTLVLDRNGRLLRAFANAEGRWRLPVTAREADPRFLALLIAVEDKRFPPPRGRRPARAPPRRRTGRPPWPDRLGRLDAHDAGRAAPGAARGAITRREAPPDRARGRDRAATEQRPDPRPLSRARALWRQRRGAAGGLARLFRPRAAPA